MVSVYRCKEIDLRGRVIETVYRAESKGEIINLIRSKGHRPVAVNIEEEKGNDIAQIELFQKKVKVNDISIFCKQMHTMLNAGMPLLTSLDVLGAQTENVTLAKTVKQMATQVQKGDILSVSMKQHPKVFPSLLISMVEAGELTGNLDNVLLKMSEHYTKENRINSKVKSAMMYPTILSVLVVVVVVFMLTFVLPTFITMFNQTGDALPLPTRIVMGLSDALQAYWYIFLGVIIAVTYAVRRIGKSVEGKRFFDRLKLKMPIIKTSIAKIATSRFTRTLSTLLASGIPIIQALETSAQVTGNQVVIDGIYVVSEDIKKGIVLSSLLKKVGVFPPMMISMVNIGEESGALEEMLSKTADYYDEELDAAISKMISFIEPVMIIVMALIVGFIVIAMLLPMFDMYSNMSV
ncbi:type II secretion system F family protein [Fusibacter bizertensis]|uniref:Type II secretion system F family protein n=1 Tax=Fusibacter bizertensis TaxID=1488331 RepID=A0ABT6NGC0_9FIRM|nr:type II secretion system F family protein [Fusibacter bizertensis]MDH8679422.1 type II secretion system F family protein [Fusibacter bizertensis]